MKKKRIILASSSKYRKTLLASILTDFECISPNIDETRMPNEKPENMVMRLAINKAKKVCENSKDALVIGSDSCAYCDSKILGKPLKKDIAIEYLEFISNKIIIFYTGVCVIDSQSMNIQKDLAEYKIKLKKLSKKDITDYVDKHNPIHSSAAFRFEVAKDLLIQEFIDKENDLSGLIGLPLIKLQKILAN